MAIKVPRNNIVFSDKTSGGRRISDEEIARNRARLAAVIAHGEPGRAIVAPPGCADLKEIGIKPNKPKREIFEMAKNGDGTIVMDMAELTDVLERPGHEVIDESAPPPLPTKQAKRIPAPKNPKTVRLSDEDCRQAHAEYMTEPGLTVMDIAKKLGVANATLHTRWRKMGLAMKPRGAAMKAKAKAKATEMTNEQQPPVKERLPKPSEEAAAAEAAAAEAHAPVGAQTHQGTAVALASPALPPNVAAFLADMEAAGGQVHVSGEINIRIVFGEGVRP